MQQKVLLIWKRAALNYYDILVLYLRDFQVKKTLKSFVPIFEKSRLSLYFFGFVNAQRKSKVKPAW